METELAELAASAATTIVNLLTTDAWVQVKEKIGALWWRYNPGQARDIEAALEEAHLEIGDADASVARAIKCDWESRFLRLAASHNAVALELSHIITDLQKIMVHQPTRSKVRQRSNVSGHGTSIQVGGNVSISGLTSFCSHGSPTEFRCQICKSAICWECDVIEWRNRYRRDSHGAEPCVTVPTEGFGYLRKVYCFGEEWSIDGSRITKTEVSPGKVIGPFLHINDIMPQLTSLVGGDLRHVCCSCVSGALPAAAVAIASGLACERPGCGNMTDSRCRCCRGAFCREHIAPTKSAPSMLLPNLFTPRTVVTIGWGGRGHYMVPPDSFTFIGLRPWGLCEMCALERASEAERDIIAICDAHPGLWRVETSAIHRGHESRFAYEIRTRKLPAAFLQQAENKRARTVARQCGTTISDKIAILEQLSSPCRRSHFFASFKSSPLGNSRAELELAMTTVEYREWNDFLGGRGLSPFVYVTSNNSDQVDPMSI